MTAHNHEFTANPEITFSVLPEDRGAFNEVYTDIGSIAVGRILDCPPRVTLDELRIDMLYDFIKSYKVYDTFIRYVNKDRAMRRHGKNTVQIQTVGSEVIYKRVNNILDNDGVMAELVDNIEYFTRYPESKKPKPGYRLLIVPDGLTETDDLAIAMQHWTDVPTERLLRPMNYNAQHPIGSDEGYHIVFAPRHLNVPSMPASRQDAWTDYYNSQTNYISLRPATDTEALAHTALIPCVHNSYGQNRTWDLTFYRRFDEDPQEGDVSSFYVGGGINFCMSKASDCLATRAVAVPKNDV
jgi:hypothetical protein